MSTDEAIPNCIFCGQSGASEEHVIPKMISRQLLKLSPLTADHGAPMPPSTPGRNIRTSRLIQVVVKAPCEPCNNVWFNRLQRPVEDVFKTGLHDVPFTLDDAAQTVSLATWAYKTALLISLCQIERANWPSFITDRARDLYRRGRPPVGARVWLGRFDFRTAWPELVSRSEVSELVFRTGGSDYVGRQVVFTTGFLMFVVALWAVHPPKTFEFDAARPPATAIMSLWPASNSQIRWPPVDSVTYDQLNRLGNWETGSW